MQEPIATRAELEERVKDLCSQHDAVILAHNYQLGEVQDVAHFLGDSLDLSKKAQAVSAKVLVFCGVRFMGETAAILSPDKTVLVPDRGAGCPMADMIDPAGLRALRAEHPKAVVVAYVNTSAEVKAESDVCCTSANAADVVSRFPKDQEIIFVPDRNLGQNVERQTGRKMILWPGCCPVHERILPEHIAARRSELPGAKVMVHPECRPDTVAAADVALSTSGMCQYAAETETDTVFVGTELGIIYRLKKASPHKRFIPVTEQAICPDMKLVTLEKIVAALEDPEPHTVTVPEEVRTRAEAAVVRMTEAGP